MRHFKSAPIIIQIIPTLTSYPPISWGSHRHYNTSTTLTYNNKSTSIYNYINPSNEHILKIRHKNPTTKLNLCQQTEVNQTPKLKTHQTDPAMRI